MRKLYKNMIFELLDTLRTAASEAKNLFAKKNTDTLINLLADCQDCANQIGELVAEFEGAEHITISYLREYCELLYKISLEADKTDSDIDIKKELRKQLSKIRNSVENDIKTTIEMVFFPYKASMFDALESIWLAAKDDPDCDAYVVPIPYYDRNPDHSFGQMHYEGGEYPDYVPVVDWRKYNVEERRPDVIFVHNPYDEGNYVTSVHPDFYSKRLREFTDCLCYVPYFLIPGTQCDSFATTSGVINSHLVIVQNDTIRNNYVEALLGFSQVNRRYIEKKVVALGTPKSDKMINHPRYDFNYPQDWDMFIENRKVVFFNTNISMILKNSNYLIENLRRLFSIFNNHRDIALIWREHPLTFATLKSMRPNLLYDYNELRSEFITNNWGILDETPDAHAAMKLSNCYFGSGGSLVALYSFSGKPSMIMSYSYPEDFQTTPIGFEQLITENRTLKLSYLERAVNSLDLFLDNLSFFESQKDEKISLQAPRSNNLDGTVGEKVFNLVKKRVFI